MNGRDIGAKRGQRLVPQRRLRFDPSGREQVHRVENSRKAPAAELLKQPGRQGRAVERMGRNRLHRNGHTQLRRIVQHGVHAAAQDIISRRALLLRPGKKRRLGADAARPQLRRTAQPQAERIQLRLARSLIGQRRLDIAPQHGDINVVFPESRADLA